jgi:hypothetical protein
VEGTVHSATCIVLKNGTKLYPIESYDQLVLMILPVHTSGYLTTDGQVIHTTIETNNDDEGL